MFPTVDGVQGETIIVGHRATFYYDTRNNLFSPTDGMAVTAYAELNQNVRNGDNPVYSRYEIAISKKLFPSESKRAILIIRADLQATLGTQVPFFEQSSLGGQNNLRGYGVDRYIDKHLIASSIEERIHLCLRQKLPGSTADFEIAPFLDTGQVFNVSRTVSFKDYRMTPASGSVGSFDPMSSDESTMDIAGKAGRSLPGWISLTDVVQSDRCRGGSSCRVLVVGLVAAVCLHPSKTAAAGLRPFPVRTSILYNSWYSTCRATVL